MIDWNNNGIIDPVDVGISIAISQETEQEKEIAPEKKEPSLFERIKSLGVFLLSGFWKIYSR